MTKTELDQALRDFSQDYRYLETILLAARERLK